METKELVVAPAKLVCVGMENLPAVIAGAGEKAGRRFIEFFMANIRNKNTRLAYARAAGQFFAWCERRGIGPGDLEPVILSIYIERLQETHSAPTVKQHLAAIRMMFDWLVVGQVLPTNPAAAVRGIPANRAGSGPMVDKGLLVAAGEQEEIGNGLLGADGRKNHQL